MVTAFYAFENSKMVDKIQKQIDLTINPPPKKPHIIVSIRNMTKTHYSPHYRLYIYNAGFGDCLQFNIHYDKGLKLQRPVDNEIRREILILNSTETAYALTRYADALSICTTEGCEIYLDYLHVDELFPFEVWVDQSTKEKEFKIIVTCENLDNPVSRNIVV